MPAEFFQGISNQQTPPTYNFFDGKRWLGSKSHKTIAIASPINAEVIGEIQSVTRGEIDEVLKQLKSAQSAWVTTPLFKRVKIMHLAADWIRHFEEYLTYLLVREIGKTNEEAKGEILRTADLIDYFADEVQSLHGETLDSDNFPGFDKGRIAMVERVPWGVVLAIAPFNYPVNLAASKIVPAILMGNGVIFKPSTKGAISGLHLVRIFEKAGVPEGLMACVTGDSGEIGDYLVGHKNVDMVAFTGSSKTGLMIASRASMKTLLFECGGNNPAIVLPDADLALAAREIVKGAFSYSGQRCTAIKYVLTTPSVASDLIPLIVENTKEMVSMGDPRSGQTKLVGPVISIDAADKIIETIKEAIDGGAKVELGGYKKDAYIDPTILTGVKPSMKIVKNETFGPVVSLISIANTNEAIEIVNASSYGLQASVFTKDEGTGIAFAKQLNVGSVQINGSPQRGPDHFPFLGIKHSGVGVQGVRYSLEAMSRLRPIVLNKPQ